MKIKEFLEVLDVLPSAVKVSAQIRVTAYTAALSGHKITGADLSEILNRGLQEWTFYPAPAEILSLWRDIQAERYSVLMADNVGILGADGRLKIVAKSSPEGQAEIARLESEKDSPLALEVTKPRFIAAAERVLEKAVLTDEELQDRRDVQIAHLRREVGA
jgi:hypothetical protein